MAAWRQRVCIFNREKQCQLLPRKFTGLPLRLGSVFVGLNRYMSIENCLPSVYSVLNSPYSDFKKKFYNTQVLLTCCLFQEACRDWSPAHPSIFAGASTPPGRLVAGAAACQGNQGRAGAKETRRGQSRENQCGPWGPEVISVPDPIFCREKSSPTCLKPPVMNG